jgi:hypothetical protein
MYLCFIVHNFHYDKRHIPQQNLNITHSSIILSSFKCYLTMLSVSKLCSIDKLVFLFIFIFGKICWQCKS